jgi:hypothetical protein
VGKALIKISSDSKTLLNDGKGTDALRQVNSAVYDLILPPPAGPIVTSSTCPDQSKWYSVPNAVLAWSPEDTAEGYSYILSGEPTAIPDDITEGRRQNVAYKNLTDGSHYFHIKSLRKGSWGGITHFSINIDTTPPAEFLVEIIPNKRTTRKQPIIEFSTSDAHSGLDHYELKIIPLKLKEPVVSDDSVGPGQPLFIETQSPYVPGQLALGTYDIIVRAYDKAGNFREVTQRLEITTALFKVIGEKGLEIRGLFIISWIWVWIISGVLLSGLGVLAWYLRKWRRRIDLKSLPKELPSAIKEQLNQLKKYRERYGKLAVIIFLLGAILLFDGRVFAQTIELGPPLVTVLSRNISNEEIFYIGGKTEAANTEVIIYFQNLQTGETSSYNVVSDKRGDWFYRHNTFLTSGNYLLWAQSKIVEQSSPPSPQFAITVRQTALQFGSSRISYETLYLIFIIILAGVVFVLIASIIFHIYHVRKKQAQFKKEVKEAEEAVRRGFAVLRRDIQAELKILKGAKLTKELSLEAREKEEQLLKDLEEVQNYIGKEVFDIEKVEYSK